MTKEEAKRRYLELQAKSGQTADPPELLREEDEELDRQLVSGNTALPRPARKSQKGIKVAA